MPDDRSTPLQPLKWYKELADKKGRLAAQAFLVEGLRAIKQIISNRPDAILEIIATREPPSIYCGYAQRLVTESQLRSISSTQTPQGIIAVVRLDMNAYTEHLPDDVGAKILLLEDIQDPGNVGTLIRSAVAFGFSGIILTEKCADPFSPKCVQSTAGTLLSLWLRRTNHYLDLIGELSRSGYTLVSADIEGEENISVLQNREKLVLALGNEAAGLSQTILQHSDYIVKVPMDYKKAESLNVAACGAICMYLSSL